MGLSLIDLRPRKDSEQSLVIQSHLSRFDGQSWKRLVRLLDNTVHCDAHTLQENTHWGVAKAFIDDIRQFISNIPQTERGMNERQTEW